jgi:uncharacterized protein
MVNDSPPALPTSPKNKRFLWRKWLRIIHRDVGYLAIGLTFVYALSGIAVNHIKDWDPNFSQINQEYSLSDSSLKIVPGDSEQNMSAARSVLQNLSRNDSPTDVYSLDEKHLDITLEHTTLYVDLDSETVREEGQRSRPLLRLANWLHLNRGKVAWTYIADAYAVFLLYLATSGLFMFSGRKGIFGRAGILAVLGAGIPVAYVLLSGGP